MKTLLKFALGIALAGIIFWKAPLTEVATTCFLAVVIPLGVLVSLGLIGSSTLEVMSEQWRRMVENFIQGFADGVKAQRESLDQNPATAAAGVEQY